MNRWRVAAASVTGEEHSKRGAACEDSYSVEQTLNGFVVAVVSDGAGSAACGGVAAEKICTSVEQMCRQLESGSLSVKVDEICHDVDSFQDDQFGKLEDLVMRHLTLARESLLEHAQASGQSASSYLATVVGVIAQAELGVLTFHLGDGAVSVLDDEGETLLTSQPQNGEYLNQTYFLVEEWWREHLRFSRSASLPVGSLFLMTDGVTELAYHRQGRELTPAAVFFKPLNAYLMTRSREDGEATLRRILCSDQARELVDDDKTLVWINLA